MDAPRIHSPSGSSSNRDGSKDDPVHVIHFPLRPTSPLIDGSGTGNWRQLVRTRLHDDACIVVNALEHIYQFKAFCPLRIVHCSNVDKHLETALHMVAKETQERGKVVLGGDASSSLNTRSVFVMRWGRQDCKYSPNLMTPFDASFANVMNRKEFISPQFVPPGIAKLLLSGVRRCPCGR